MKKEEFVGTEVDDQPIENPYIAGNPVTGDLFVGRKDIFRRLEELWRKSGQCESVVIYGHRRMGKSSIFEKFRREIWCQYYRC